MKNFKTKFKAIEKKFQQGKFVEVLEELKKLEVPDESEDGIEMKISMKLFAIRGMIGDKRFSNKTIEEQLRDVKHDIPVGDNKVGVLFHQVTAEYMQRVIVQEVPPNDADDQQEDDQQEDDHQEDDQTWFRTFKESIKKKTHGFDIREVTIPKIKWEWLLLVGLCVWFFGLPFIQGFYTEYKETQQVVKVKPDTQVVKAKPDMQVVEAVVKQVIQEVNTAKIPEIIKPRMMPYTVDNSLEITTIVHKRRPTYLYTQIEHNIKTWAKTQGFDAVIFGTIYELSGQTFFADYRGDNSVEIEEVLYDLKDKKNIFGFVKNPMNLYLPYPFKNWTMGELRIVREPDLALGFLWENGHEKTSIVADNFICEFFDKGYGFDVVLDETAAFNDWLKLKPTKKDEKNTEKSEEIQEIQERMKKTAVTL